MMSDDQRTSKNTIKQLFNYIFIRLTQNVSYNNNIIKIFLLLLIEIFS